MKHEEQLQQQVESGKADNSLESRVYQRVFFALSQDTGPALSPDFADKVVAVVRESKESKWSRLEVCLAFLGGFFSLGLLFVAIVLTGFSIELGFLNGLGSFKGVLFFGVAFVIALNWIERWFSRHKEPA